MSSPRAGVAHLGDFTLDRRVLAIVCWSIPVGPGLTSDASPPAARRGRNGHADPHGSPGQHGARQRETEST